MVDQRDDFPRVRRRVRRLEQLEAVFQQRQN
jgi:hypothetical protein